MPQDRGGGETTTPSPLLRPGLYSHSLFPSHRGWSDAALGSLWVCLVRVLSIRVSCKRRRWCMEISQTIEDHLGGYDRGTANPEVFG
jgi:hypothetical protein